MKTQEMLLSEIKPNPNNPRIIKDDKFRKLVESIKTFPRMLEIRPIVLNKDKIILGGNMRLRACKEAGLKKVPVIFADDLTEDQQREFIIKDNVGFGEWDWAMLANEWDYKELDDWGLTLPNFDVDITKTENIENQLEEQYSQKLGEVIYEPKNTNHKILDLYTIENKFINAIEKLENKEIKNLFIARSYIFTKFNFSKIADYYAYQANNDEKELFENMGMVLLDKDKLIKNGFSELIEDIKNNDYE